MSQRPFLGHGVGLRVPHYQRALSDGLDIDWVECITENFLGGGGRPRAVLARLRRDMPLVFHGVSLGIGSAAGPDTRYLNNIRRLFTEYEPAWVSDHLCWTHHEGLYSHDLLPLPYTEEALRVVGRHVEQVQEFLGRPLVLENVSSYVGYSSSVLAEWEFLNELCRRSGCRVLLDLNNVIVNSVNHGSSASEFVDGIVADYVWQFHLANHTDLGHYRLDSHEGQVPEAVWSLYRQALKRFGRVSTLVEWDEAIPAWETLRAEQRRAASIEREWQESAGPGTVAATARGFEEQLALPAPAPSLRSLQAQLFALIAHPTGAREWLQELAPSERTELEAAFRDSPAFSRVERLEVYAQGYFFRLLDVLREQFPLLAYRLGGEPFHNLVTDYVLAHPSVNPSLAHLGDALPEFLSRSEFNLLYPEASELAAIELAQRRALDAADEPSVSAQELALLPAQHWGNLRFQFAVSSALIATTWDYAAFALEYKSGTPPSRPGIALAAPRHLLVHRKGHEVLTRELPAVEATLLHAAFAGASFEELGALAQSNALSTEFVVARLLCWLNDELIVRWTA
jgi:uncharacterized protein (UPF0276 family)